MVYGWPCRRCTLSFALLVVVIQNVDVAAALAVHISSNIYVNPVTGNDDLNDGTTQTTAFRSLLRAAEALASRKDLGTVAQESTMVHVAPGEYVLEQALIFDERHSNSHWKRMEGADGKVLIRGGYRIDPSLFRIWPNNKNVLVAPIDEAAGDLGHLQGGSLQDCSNSKAEAFFQGEALILARYPNIDLDHNNMWQWERIKNVTSDSSFVFTGDRPITRHYIDAPDLWLHGYFTYDWADNYVRVNVNETDQTYNIDTNTSGGALYGLSNGARYYVVNLLQELDSPGEYYIDREQRRLYFFPPSGPQSVNEQTEIIISTLETWVIAYNVTNLILEGIDFTFSRGIGISLTNVSGVRFQGGSVSNVGGSYAIFVQESNNVQIVGTEISRCACGGIKISGGDRKLLSRSDISVLGNSIHSYARWKRTYMPAISFEGCGHIVSGNRIFAAPHMGISGKGNECTFSYNYLHDLCYESVDCGAFYVGRSYAERGNIVESNIFERIRKTENATRGYSRVQGIYLDDMNSGWSLVDNTFVDCDIGILVGGGRDNQVFGSKFTNVKTPLHVDRRGLSFGSLFCKVGGSFESELNNYNYKKPPWSLQYPELISTYDSEPCVPSNNTFHGLKLCEHDSSWFQSPDSGIAELLLWNNSFSDIVVDRFICDTTPVNDLTNNKWILEGELLQNA